MKSRKRPPHAAALDTELTSAELDRLSGFLDSIDSETAMNIEQLDGFFSALIAGPEQVMPSEYYPHIFGDKPANAPTYDSLEHAQEIMGLLMRHWNTIARRLNAGEVYVPVFLEDDDGIARGNDWAKGFLHSLDLRRASWQAFLHDEDHAGAIVPMFALAHENDPDPKLRFESPHPDKRNDLLAQMAAGLMQIHNYFKARRPGPASVTPIVRTQAKVGRNESCPCGSGKKFKRCCGAQLH